MDKDSFFSNDLIKSFLNDFEKSLSALPPDLKEQYKSEIKSDLYANAVELLKLNINVEVIPQEVLKNFLSPKSLAAAIQNEHNEETKIVPPINKTTIQAYTVFSIAPLGALALPILFGNINISSSLPLIIAFIISNLIFIFNIKKIIWDDRILTYLKKMITVCLTVILPISLAFFSIHIIINSSIDEFSMYYLLLYLLFLFIYIMSLSSLLKIKKQA